MPRLLVALLWGVVAFVVTYIVVLIIAAVLNAVGVPQAAVVLNHFAWIISLLAGLIYFFSRYGSPLPRP